MPKKMIVVGTGGFGTCWCENFLPPNIKDKTIEVVAAVDANPEALSNARQFLGLKDEQCYTDIAKCFGTVRADCCALVIPPNLKEKAVMLALENGLHILCEKPIAEDLKTAKRIAAKVKKARKKMAITMSHRFDQDKRSLKRELDSKKHGRLDYVSCRLTCSWRDWFKGKPTWRDRMADFVLQDCAVHHMDLLADLAGAPCEELYAESWTKPWSGFNTNTQCLVTMKMENGVRVLCEFGLSNAASLNSWGQEYIRAECEKSTLILDHRRLECFPYDPKGRYGARKEGEGKELPLMRGRKWSNALLIEQFAKWLAGGPKMETNIADNLQAMALVEAAVMSNTKGKPIKVQELLG